MRAVGHPPGRVSRSLRALGACACLLALASPAGAAAAPREPSPPKPIALDSGWEIRDVGAPPAPPQPPPPEEGAPPPNDPAPGEPQPPAGQDGSPDEPPLILGRASQDEAAWEPTTVPGVFDARALPFLYAGQVKEYRLRFRAPRTRTYNWAFHFEQSRRRTTVFLNGRQIGLSADPYTPFDVPARGLRPGQVNELRVVVDSRKDPKLAEGWWNWGGIVRPVRMVPRGRAQVSDLGLLSDVECRRAGRACSANLLIDGILDRLPQERVRRERAGGREQARGDQGRRLPRSQPTLGIRLRSPTGRVSSEVFDLNGTSSGRRRVSQEMPVPATKLWSPDKPQLYRARVVVRYRGRVEQVQRLRIGLRQVEVEQGMLRVNNRPVNLRGASIHEDFPRTGAALNGAQMDTIVRELQEVGANVTRAHWVMSDGLLRRLDRAGIMVWNQAAVWQRDHLGNLLATPVQRRRAVNEVKGSILAARNHPSVITHSVANELTYRPNRKIASRGFIIQAHKRARELDPTIPISLDLKARKGLGRQHVYRRFDMLGMNVYYGWYTHIEDFAELEPYLAEMRQLYPKQALVVTEFGAEGRPDSADAPPEKKGGYAFQTAFVAQNLELFDRTPFLSGVLHWTLREFEIFPGWLGGADFVEGDKTRHHKGVLTYDGQRKPAWDVLRDAFGRVPLYRR